MPVGACPFCMSSGAADLERPFLPAGADHFRQFEDTATGLTVFAGESPSGLEVPFTGLTLAALPITLLHIVLSKQFTCGITQGAIK
ncbi:hypothetical protein [Mesorhizobium sp. WSM4906]|uniref:hypothetical protein n=1 Tax=Mesorhizobium sp. WSM4906 TaxID=3038546 RepID=UPI00241658FE|nr:hypothetical protein [Mesorhizobium sp. WSM4906]WFP78783.1 hypothetical protein QAZ22_13650 [Mesorhizobium sp. WSM4906]